jgi:ASF1 like histone chaperone
MVFWKGLFDEVRLSALPSTDNGRCGPCRLGPLGFDGPTARAVVWMYSLVSRHIRTKLSRTHQICFYRLPQACSSGFFCRSSVNHRHHLKDPVRDELRVAAPSRPPLLNQLIINTSFKSSVAPNMAAVNVTEIKVFQNPCIFTSGFHFEVTFECSTQLSSGKFAKIDRGKPWHTAQAVILCLRRGRGHAEGSASEEDPAYGFP